MDGKLLIPYYVICRVLFSKSQNGWATTVKLLGGAEFVFDCGERSKAKAIYDYVTKVWHGERRETCEFNVELIKRPADSEL